MWTQLQMSFALRQLKPLIVEKNIVAVEMAVQQLGLDFVVSDAFLDYCRINRDSVMIGFLATLALHNTANADHAALSSCAPDCGRGHVRGGYSENKPEMRPPETSQEYRYNDFSIYLPANHMLPTYQKQHPKYDRFLPHLARYIRPSETIIDIGANVGDTLAGMAEQNSTASYICIEPDELFYWFLEENIQRIKLCKKDLQVQTINALVGKNISGVSLEGHGGTKHAVMNKEGGIQSKSLNELLEKTFYQNIRILKTDVDGFDYDVLQSSISVIHDHKPIIFFECQYDFCYQKEGYEKLFHSLESEGYSDWTIFDNFGEIIIRTNNLDAVNQLINYVWNQNIRRTTRTIYYYDVLAIQDQDAPLIDRVLADFN